MSIKPFYYRSPKLKRWLVGAFALMMASTTSTASAQTKTRAARGKTQPTSEASSTTVKDSKNGTKGSKEYLAVRKPDKREHIWHYPALMSSYHGDAADIGWGMNPLNVGPYVSGSARCVDFVNSSGYEVFPFVQSSQQPWTYNSFFSYVTSESSYESEAQFRRSVNFNGALGFSLKDSLAIELDGGYSSNSEHIHNTSSSQNSIDFVFSARALGPKFHSNGNARIRTSLVDDIVDSTSNAQERTNLWLQKCGIGYVDSIRLGAYLRVEMHIHSKDIETQIQLTNQANWFFNGSATGSGSTSGSNQAQNFLNSLNASFSYDASTESIVGVTANNQHFSITFDVSSEGPFFNVGPITTLQQVWNLFTDFPTVVQSVQSRYLAGMQMWAKPYNSAINTSELLINDGSPTLIDYDDMAEVNMRMVMQEDISELFFNYQFEKAKLNTILDDYASVGVGIPYYYEFWHPTTYGDLISNASEDERISYAAARALYCLADFTETVGGCHLQTFVDTMGFTYTYDLWSSAGVPLVPQYQAPRRIGNHTTLGGRQYYDWVMSQGAINNVVEIDGDSTFSVLNSGASKKFTCKDETFWQTSWEQCIGYIMYDIPFSPGWSVITSYSQSGNDSNRYVSVSQTPNSTRLHLDMRHKKSSTTPSWLLLNSASFIGPYNWGWVGFTPANYLLEALN